ncbi:hypothetical protein [Effusibacillus consociatus]|uniref:Uncharacterized protein n=1 Tax=Effusibacillus consociatus TaxID=1117041 RepID=A0ABV9Q4S0_9BACL
MRFMTVLMLLAGLTVLAGCNNPKQALPKVGGPAIQGVIGEGPISELDLPIVERQLLEGMKIRAAGERPLKIVQTAHTSRVSYVLYSMPNNDGLAVVSKQGPNVRILNRIPIVPGDPNKNLVSYNTIVAGNPWDPDNGVVFGIVYNPYIKTIEAFFRDTTKVKVDVTNPRGFIIIRPGADTRFVQINAIGDGGLWWTQDTR